MKGGKGMRQWMALVGVALLLGSGEMVMSENSSASEKRKDGELSYPADYKTWSQFLTNIDKEQAKQVRDIYLNPTGAKAKRGEMFPDETTMVMEIYKAKESTAGGLEKAADGKLTKDKLAKVFVMTKKQGWGQDVPDNLKNGSWVFFCVRPGWEALGGRFYEVPSLSRAAGCEGFCASIRRIF
jgi:Cytochrome P460